MKRHPCIVSAEYRMFPDSHGMKIYLTQIGKEFRMAGGWKFEAQVFNNPKEASNAIKAWKERAFKEHPPHIIEMYSNIKIERI